MGSCSKVINQNAVRGYNAPILNRVKEFITERKIIYDVQSTKSKSLAFLGRHI